MYLSLSLVWFYLAAALACSSAASGLGFNAFSAGITSLANRRMLFSALSIGIAPYLKMNMISSVPNALASSVARLMVCSGVPHGWVL